MVKSYKLLVAGTVANVGKSKAEFLLKNGYAIKSKDMTSNDYKTG